MDSRSGHWQTGGTDRLNRDGVVDDFTQVQREIISFYTAYGKPRFRGWIHVGFAPLAFIAGLVLILLSGGGTLEIACAVFAFTGVLLFGASGIYHRGYWSAGTRMLLKRLDHANITLLIAGTYTPMALTLLSGTQSSILLWSVWGCALLVSLFRIFWTGAPRWLYTPLYVMMGLIAVFFMGDFWQICPEATFLICTGGITYIVGAVVYATKKPALLPQVFGFHELFHVLTVLGFAQHYMAVLISVFHFRS